MGTGTWWLRVPPGEPQGRIGLDLGRDGTAQAGGGPGRGVCQGHYLLWDLMEGTGLWGSSGRTSHARARRRGSPGLTRGIIWWQYLPGRVGTRSPHPQPPLAQPRPQRHSAAERDRGCARWAPNRVEETKAQRGGRGCCALHFYAPWQMAPTRHLNTLPPTDACSAVWSQWPGGHIHRQLLSYLGSRCPGPRPSGKWAHEDHPPSPPPCPMTGPGILSRCGGGGGRRHLSQSSGWFFCSCSCPPSSAALRCACGGGPGRTCCE